MTKLSEKPTDWKEVNQKATSRPQVSWRGA